MFRDQREIPVGTTVYDANGEKVGTVHENNVQDAYLVVQKGWLFHKDFYVPLSAIGSADPDGVYLTVRSDQLADPQYDVPPALPLDQSQGASTYTPAITRDQVGIDRSAQDIRIPVREEELVAGKERVEEGRVHIHKDVVTEQRTVDVPLQQERVIVERVPFSGDATTADDAFVERDIDVPVMGEEAVVGKRVQGVEEVVIHKDVVTEQQQVSDTVRKERVVVDGLDSDGQATERVHSQSRSTGGPSMTDRVKNAAQDIGEDLRGGKDRITGE